MNNYGTYFFLSQNKIINNNNKVKFMANVTLDGILIIAYHDSQFYWSWYIQYMEKDHTLDSHYSLPVGQLRNAPRHELNYLKTKNNEVLKLQFLCI
jgi:hypothetical protein